MTRGREDKERRKEKCNGYGGAPAAAPVLLLCQTQHADKRCSAQCWAPRSFDTALREGEMGKEREGEEDAQSMASRASACACASLLAIGAESAICSKVLGEKRRGELVGAEREREGGCVCL